MAQLKDKVDVEDFVRGCAFMGTGGGGDPKEGIKWLTSALEKGKTIEWVDPSEVPADANIASVSGVGSIAPETEEMLEKKRELGLTERTVDNVYVKALEELEEYTGEKVDYLVPTELGGSNTPAPLVTAALVGIKVVDGDYAGRAIPELTQITPALNKCPTTPRTNVDEYGNVRIIKSCSSLPMAERVGKMLSVTSFGLSGEAKFMMDTGTMKGLVVPNTLSKCLAIGSAIRTAREEGRDPVQAAAEEAGGWVVFEGEVVEKDDRDEEGYYWGTNTIKGWDTFEGEEMKIWFKNENHIAWKNDTPYITSPDLITVLDAESGEPITNTDLDVGRAVSVIGVKATDERYREEKALDALGPSHFGFDIDYVPIEERIDTS